MLDRKGRAIIAVDLLRFACAILVVAYHFTAGDWITPSRHAAVALSGLAAPASYPVTRVGWIGVELFFVISGFVIARSAVGTDTATFLRRRALRLLPAAWICATLTALVLAVSGQADDALFLSWARSMVFVPVGEQIDGSYWTLGVEIVFYLVVAAFGRGVPARIERVALALGVISGSFWVVSLWSPAIGALGNDRSAMLLLLPHGCLFALGVTIAMLAERVTRTRVLSLCAWTVAALVEIATHAVERFQHGVPASTSLATAIFLGGLALLLAANKLQDCLARLVAPRTARAIGLMTYPLYLLHQDAGAAVMAVIGGLGLSTSVAAWLTITIVFAIAWLIADRLEPSVRRRLVTIIRFRGPAPDNRRNASLPTG